ncbi:MAG: glycosyltransferase family 2 protein [Candidatus Omnitrophota bacterium]
MPIDLSIVTPVHNEEGNLHDLYESVRRAIPEKYTWEMWFIDDGSTDSSREKIREICQNHTNAKAIFFPKNFGHQIALTAGLDHAEGRAVITMDSDLQHPPESIPAMLDAWEKGADIVFAVRDRQKDMPWFKNLTSRLFYRFLRAVSHLDLVNSAADFRLLSRKVVECLRQYRERDRFLRGMVSDIGFNQARILYRENPRRNGISKYSLIKMIKLAITGTLSFSSVPLRACSTFGFFIAALSVLYALYIIYDKLAHGAPAGIPSILVGVFFIGGLQLIFIGVLGEYLMTVFKEVKQRPLYWISEKINH